MIMDLALRKCTTDDLEMVRDLKLDSLIFNFLEF